MKKFVAILMSILLALVMLFWAGVVLYFDSQESSSLAQGALFIAGMATLGLLIAEAILLVWAFERDSDDERKRP